MLAGIQVCIFEAMYGKDVSGKKAFSIEVADCNLRL